MDFLRLKIDKKDIIEQFFSFVWKNSKQGFKLSV